MTTITEIVTAGLDKARHDAATATGDRKAFLDRTVAVGERFLALAQANNSEAPAMTGDVIFTRLGGKLASGEAFLARNIATLGLSVLRSR